MAVKQKDLVEIHDTREFLIFEARRSFWHFCKVADDPEFYKDDHWHLKLDCWVLQALYERRLTKENFYVYCTDPKNNVPASFIREFDWDRLQDGKVYDRLIQNMPPRHGKSRTLVNFTKWALGKDKSNKVITCSYNDDLATEFSRFTRDGIMEEKTYPHEIVFSDIFPETQIKKGDASYKKWALEGQHFSYKGAGVQGTVTGKGCNISIVDDPVKDAEEALNNNALNKIWTWYTGTFLSRLEENGLQIVNMTRWASGDVCGRILGEISSKGEQTFGAEKDEWFVLRLEVKDKEDNMLCPELMSNKSYNSKKANMLPEIFMANYHQKPIDVKGRLYKSFKTYSELPMHPFEKIIAYTDTADTGEDYLCSIVAGIYMGEAYVLDVYYTKEGMEITEPETAALFVRNDVDDPLIESNNGGRGFARNVERLIWENHHKRITVRWFHQSKNKRARIISGSTFVMNHIYFPWNWKDRWPDYYDAMTSYQKEGKNDHDDGPDCTTGLGEMINGKKEAGAW